MDVTTNVFCAALNTESLFSLVFSLLAEWCIKGYVYQDVRGYAVKNDVDKANIRRREKEIGPILKQRLNLEACSVRQGSGTSNCGNTSRRAFAQPEIFADIVNMPVDLIKESVATVLKFHETFHSKPTMNLQMKLSFLSFFFLPEYSLLVNIEA